jgi:hypothetical protein
MPAYINKLEQPQHMEGTILGPLPDRRVIATIRVKPSTILWKPRGQTKYYSVSLEKFAEWIMSPKTHADRVSS